MTHRDRDTTTPTRSLSFVYYMNPAVPAWNISEDGGALQLWRGVDEPERLLAVVAPKHDRLVVFDSELYHEVRPCHRHRFSLNAWVNSRRADRRPAAFSPIPPATMVSLVRRALGAIVSPGPAEPAGEGGNGRTREARGKAALLARIASARGTCSSSSLSVCATSV